MKDIIHECCGSSLRHTAELAPVNLYGYVVKLRQGWTAPLDTVACVQSLPALLRKRPGLADKIVSCVTEKPDKSVVITLVNPQKAPRPVENPVSEEEKQIAELTEENRILRKAISLGFKHCMNCQQWSRCNPLLCLTERAKLMEEGKV